MAMNPRSWIYNLIDLVPGFLSAPARWIADRIFGIFDDGVEFAKWLKSGVDYLRSKGTWFADRVRAYAVEAYTTLKWLLDIRIPALIASATSTLRTWATNLITLSINAVKALLSTLDKWAKAAVSAVVNALTAFRDWAAGKINGLIDRLKHTVDVWYDRLTDPRKFAAWVIGAIVLALFSYAYANRDKIATWFLRSSPAFTAWLAKELESVLKRLL